MPLVSTSIPQGQDLVQKAMGNLNWFPLDCETKVFDRVQSFVELVKVSFQMLGDGEYNPISDHFGFELEDAPTSVNMGRMVPDLNL